MEPRSLCLIDLSSIFWMNWHATADKEYGEAFERTIAKVQSVSAGYDLVAICCDSPPYFRKEIHPEYKAQRDKPSEVSLEQFRRVKERLTADAYLLWSVPSFEADDVIATAVRLGMDDKGIDGILVASSDKDLLQLVNDDYGVRVLSIASGKMYERADVIAKFGVDPAMLGDALALIGDSSDNIPGVPGVGPKKAATLLNEFGSLPEVLANCDKIKGDALKQAIFSGADAARLARKLVALRDDVPIVWEDLFVKREPQKLSKDEPEDADFDPISPPAPPPTEETKSAPKTVEPPSEPPKTTALARLSGWEMQLEPRDGNGAYVLAKKLHDSRIYQKFGTAEAIFAVILRGRALGMDATLALDAFHVIEGKPVMHADLIEALVIRSGLQEYFEIVETTESVATYATKRKSGRREVKISFSIESAFRAGLVERHPQGQDGFRGVSRSGKPSNWDKYRATMLRHRAKTQLARAVYPDVVLGLYTPDELGHDGVIDAEFEVAAE